MALSGGPLERRSMSDEAYNRLQDAIISGELRPGERLRDYELAERLGTSKTPIRHALDRLADHGLVEMQRNRYTRVAPIDLDQVRNAVDLFGDIWIGSVRHVMPLIQDDDIAYLTDLADEMAASVKARDVAGFGIALRATATGFARIEGNASRAGIIERLGPQIRRFSQHSRDAFDWEVVGAFVVSLREAILERDAVKTRAVLVTFFDEVLPAIIDRAQEQELIRSDIQD
ncbi:GntR family transcriptional regulator [Microbacterium sp. NPDC091662]|uniref:GntR family transcriptional regulator n=1 Tax=Microbacterium sp. NPDC091662 TaxID=3364211 RepID=UPI0037FDEC48